jgi:hypothetical protein
MEIRREQFVSSKDFLRSARDMGIGVEEGVYEIVDNALDAGAVNIWIEIEKKADGNFDSYSQTMVLAFPKNTLMIKELSIKGFLMCSLMVGGFQIHTDLNRLENSVLVCLKLHLACPLEPNITRNWYNCSYERSR